MNGANMTGQENGVNVSIVDMDDDGVWTHMTWSGQVHLEPATFAGLLAQGAAK